MMKNDQPLKQCQMIIFSAQNHDRQFFDKINRQQFTTQGFILSYYKASLTKTSVNLAQGSDAVCIFVNDQLDGSILKQLSELGVRAVLLRCAGFDNIDLQAAKKLGLFVARVPEYSPGSVAEHTIALIMTLTRHIHRTDRRVREGNFALDGLLGKTVQGKTVGIIGTGKIGLMTARILKGFGCHLLGYDTTQTSSFREIGHYVELDTLLSQADIVSLHCPLIKSTHHLINEKTLAHMKRGAMLVNTSRGEIVDTSAIITALKSQQLGGFAIDVYEREAPLFFRDHSSEIIDDEVFQCLISFPNVIMTGHQGFFTEEALSEIVTVTLQNLQCFAESRLCQNVLE